MIYDKDDFEIKYWGGDYVSFNDDFETPKKPPRSIRKKLAISLIFVVIIALTPLIFFGISNIDLNSHKNVVVVDNGLQKKTVKQDTIDYRNPTPTSSVAKIQSVEVVNNDSYWKITKRTCGSGQKYLTTQNLNEGKALHIGDTVLVNCSI